jgi:O-antigen ligase
VIWAAYPIAGAGANAFRMVYPQYRTASSAGFMTHAHNEYAQLLCETGVIGLCMSAVL